MKSIITLAVVVALFCGYWYFIYAPADTEVVVPMVEVEEVVELSDSPVISAPAQIAQFSNTDFGFGFKYRIKPYGYSVFENTAAQNVEQNMLFGVTLVRSGDYNESVRAAAEGNAHDGPPAISVLVFDAPNVSDVPVWLTQNKLVTNCEPDTVLSTVLANKDASSCLWDGLYQGVTVALLQDNKIYLVTGTREGNETPDGYSYEKDFND
jgi:hypothetical protein